MKKNVRFYICEKCKNQIGLIHDNGNPIFCCEKEMKRMKCNQIQTSNFITYTKSEDEIIVTIRHPINEKHHIMWVALVSDHITIRQTLYPEQTKTTIKFKYIPNSSLYCYCNNDGLFQIEI